MQLAAVERREGVEERHDPGRRHELHDEHDGRRHEPTPEPGQRPGPLEEGQHDGEQRAAEHQREQQALEEIGHERGRRRAVESVPLLDDERRVDPKREAQDHRGGAEPRDVDQTGDDRPEAQAAHDLIEPLESARLPPHEEHRELDRAPQQPEAGTDPRVVLRPRIAVAIEHAGELGRQRRAERAQAQRGGHGPEYILANEGYEDDDRIDVHGTESPP